MAAVEPLILNWQNCPNDNALREAIAELSSLRSRQALLIRKL